MFHSQISSRDVHAGKIRSSRVCMGILPIRLIQMKKLVRLIAAGRAATCNNSFQRPAEHSAILLKYREGK